MEKLLEVGGLPEGTIIKRFGKQIFGNDFDRLCACQALVHVGNLKDIAIVEGDSEMTVDVVRRDGKNMYFSPSDGWVGVLEEDIALYKIDFEWLVGQVMKALEVPSRCNAKTLLDDTIWVLGEQRIRNQRIVIVLVRGLAQPAIFGALCEYLRGSHTARNPALVLSLDRQIPEHLQLPQQNILVRLEEALIIESDSLEINSRLLAGKLSGQVSQDGFSPGYRVLSWNGQEFEFTPKQADVVEYLHKAGQPRHKHEILAAIGTSQKRLIDIFRKDGKPVPAWGTVIKHDNKGNYRLEL